MIRSTQPLLAATLVTVALTIAPTLASAEPAIVIKNATVWTAADKKTDAASVVIKDGVITAVGTKVSVPRGATVVDGTGKVVTAGLIDAMTSVGISEVALVGNTNDARFGTTRGGIFASYRVADGWNESSVSIPLARSHGVTAAIVTPSGGFIAGIGAAYGMADTAAGLEIRREVALYANLGAAAMRTNHGSRGLAIARLRELFDDADRYSRNKAAFDRNQSRKLAAGRLDLEALLLVKKGTIPLVVRTHRASDIRAALRLARDLRIRLVIAGGTEAWKVADDLAKQDVAVMLEPSANLPSSFDQVHVQEDNAARLVAAKVKVIISTLGSAANVRNLRQLAGIAVARGLTWSQALDSVTRVPATVFGLGKRGGIEVGAVADVVVWSGDPFEISTAAENVYIGGKAQSLESRQTRLLQRYRKLPPR